LCGVNIGNPTDESVPPEDLAETDAACEQKRSTEKSATSSDSDSETLAAESESAPEIAPDKQGFDVDDISDSLVDDLFNNYVGKIETSSSKRHEKDSGDSKRDTDGARKPRSTRKKKTPETEGRKPTEPAPVNTHDAPGLLNSETEIEAKSLLVESISDLLANIKKPDSPEIIAPEGAPLAPGEPETEAMVEQVPDEASRRLDRQEKDSVCDPLDFMNTGISNYRGKRYEDAIIAFKNVLKIVPENRDALVLLGNSYYRNNMTKEALATYETLKKKYPDESIAHENLGLIYAEQGLHQLAIKEWKTVLNLNPHRTDLMEKINLAANRKRDSAGTDIDTQSRRKKDDSQRIKEKQSGLLEQGIAFYRNRDFDKAIQVFESLIETYPAFEEAYGFLGITYFRSNRLREAKAVFQKLQPFKRENASTHENLGLIYAKEGSFDLALEEWKKALALTPHRSDIKEKINQVSQLI
ncbi:MAG: tetratricopeptide repeat protein, partial [bacterium]